MNTVKMGHRELIACSFFTVDNAELIEFEIIIKEMK